MPALEMTSEHKASGRVSDDSPSIRQCVEHAAHLLPTQGPIEVFVHHNTLHAFEHLPFHDAVLAGLNRYQGEPYLPEQDYRQLYQAGRITDDDLEAVIQQDLGERGTHEINGLGTLTDIRFAMLRHPFHVGPDAELRWVVAETDALDRFRDQTTRINRTRMITSARRWLENHAQGEDCDAELRGLLVKFGPHWNRWKEDAWESFSLHLLWRICLRGARSFTATPAPRNPVRPRDLLLQTTGEDVDRYTSDLLIRFCAAYVDQGYSDWLLPNRELGFFESFSALYRKNSRGMDRWLRGLSAELAKIQEQGDSLEDSIASSLHELGVGPRDRQEFITQTLLAAAGWAGMIWRLETGISWVVHSVPQDSLLGMLAVQLILEKLAIRHIGAQAFGESGSISAVLQRARRQLTDPAPLNAERNAFLLFQIAQMLGWTPLELLELTCSQWQELHQEVQRFTALRRRQIFHIAYERKYLHAALDAFGIHAARRRDLGKSWLDRPSFQLVTCIDDREESFRRHLEETEPTCQTFGAAGFFTIAMYYRGAADGFYKPLCPGVMTPGHYVQEDVGYNFEGVHQNRAKLRRHLGLANHAFHLQSRSFLGGVIAGAIGSLATGPLVARVLFPHLTARIRRGFGSLIQPPLVTNLQLERYAKDPGPTNGHVGYTTQEMADVVFSQLQDIGLTKSEDFARLFILCGHGSSSLNNPHESAYCCGACAGKRGGPNARAFAQMANDWRVRAKVATRGIAIPDDTVFIGAYHNTCDDSVLFFDLDRLPASHRTDFDSARKTIEEARQRNAHERCRRFISAPLDLTPGEALRHVEGRSQDISQVRPEYNHATNVLCVVGRRNWSRGLYMDRRAFLTSYDPTQDDEQFTVLARVLAAAIPVCAGINLEYYFSRVDVTHYGSGSKLPHNIVSLLGVIEGTSSDLRTGLHQQMVEIHEPMRMVTIIDTTPKAMLKVMEGNPAIDRLVRGEWLYLAVMDPDTSEISIFEEGDFRRYSPSDTRLAEVESSRVCYAGHRDHRPFFSIRVNEVTQ